MVCCAKSNLLRKKPYFSIQLLFIFAIMETKKQIVIEETLSIEDQCVVNRLDSGLPRWLIEVAFVCYLMQAVLN